MKRNDHREEPLFEEKEESYAYLQSCAARVRASAPLLVGDWAADVALNGDTKCTSSNREFDLEQATFTETCCKGSPREADQKLSMFLDDRGDGK